MGVWDENAFRVEPHDATRVIAGDLLCLRTGGEGGGRHGRCRWEGRGRGGHGSRADKGSCHLPDRL